jgi:hypothetical protein
MYARVVSQRMSSYHHQVCKMRHVKHQIRPYTSTSHTEVEDA